VRKFEFLLGWIGQASACDSIGKSIWGWPKYYEAKAIRRPSCLEEVMMAFALIQPNLSKGQSSCNPMNNSKIFGLLQTRLFGQSKNRKSWKKKIAANPFLLMGDFLFRRKLKMDAQSRKFFSNHMGDDGSPECTFPKNDAKWLEDF